MYFREHKDDIEILTLLNSGLFSLNLSDLSSVPAITVDAMMLFKTIKNQVSELDADN
jgi:hypothetical protein